MTDPIRLDKHLVAQLGCSRREAELYIAGGWVRVDGEIVEEPQFKVTAETVSLDADAQAVALEPATLIWHKPAGIDLAAVPSPIPTQVTAQTRVAEDPSGVRPLKRHFQHLASVVPLEAFASGLIVLTQDGRVVRALEEHWERYEHEYVVEVDGKLAGGLEAMQRGRGIEGAPPGAIKVSWQSEARLRIAAKGIQPGHIRTLCETAGLSVRAIRRLRIGRVSMARLAAGEWRYLGPDERL